jgi:hypothetical protein
LQTLPAFDSIPAYEFLIYNLKNEYPQIQYSTLVLKRYSEFIAEVSGTVFFENNIHLNVKELIDFRKKQIKTYSYEIYLGREKQYWYDNQPHPNDTSLQATFPHHKHIQPNIRHNRVPSLSIHFDRPNLSFLIQEIIEKFLT